MREIIHPSESDPDRLRAPENNRVLLACHMAIAAIMNIAIFNLLFVNNDATWLCIAIGMGKHWFLARY